MNIQGLLIIALVTGTLYIGTVSANLEPIVTYEEIELLNATCPESDNCTEERYSDILDFYNCNCEEICAKYGTCCVDSEYKEPKTRKPYNCISVYGREPVFAIDGCNPTWFGDKLIEEHCTASAEEKEDLLLALPVTNLKTATTYKNYYCAVCNNDADKDQLTPWGMSLQMSQNITSSQLADLRFNRTKEVWTIGNDTDNIKNVTVYPTVKAPQEIKEIVRHCVPNVISRCANGWNDTVTEDKCAAYMAIVGVTTSDGNRRTYRNPHCALCNYESLETIHCNSWEKGTIPSRAPSNTFFVRLFSLYDKENKCGDEAVYDTIAKKCRKVFKG